AQWDAGSIRIAALPGSSNGALASAHRDIPHETLGQAPHLGRVTSAHDPDGPDQLKSRAQGQPLLGNPLSPGVLPARPPATDTGLPKEARTLGLARSEADRFQQGGDVELAVYEHFRSTN